MTIGQLLNTDSGRGGVMCTTPAPLSSMTGTVTLSHAMDRPPDLTFLRLTCVVANSNWQPGESWISWLNNVNAGGFTIVHTPGKVSLVGNGGNVTLPDRTAAGGAGLITTTSWKFELVAVWFAPLLPSL